MYNTYQAKPQGFQAKNMGKFACTIRGTALQELSMSSIARDNIKNK